MQRPTGGSATSHLGRWDVAGGNVESVAWYQIAMAVESTKDMLVAFKLSDGMYMQALIKELKLQPGLKAVGDVKDNVDDEELVGGQQSSVNGAREEKEDLDG